MYYNYFLTTPLTGNHLEDPGQRFLLEVEIARPRFTCLSYEVP